jgi:AcrR family transcriptional regulator
VAESVPAKTTKGLSPRERLLATAGRLFYREGIRSVSVDRIVAEADVTLATFYRHFATKEQLVLAYLEWTDRQARAEFNNLSVHTPDAREQLSLHLKNNAEQLRRHRYRGCAFVNAAAEYPDPASTVHQAVLTHRRWYRSAVAGLCEKADVSNPHAVADIILMLRDGAGVAGYLEDPETARREYIEAAEILLNCSDRPAG